jgi:MYXO-CTERM domain-containing protein
MNRHWMIFSVATALACCACAHASISFEDVLVEYWVGAGSSEAMMIVDWQENRTLAFGFRWEAGVPTDLDLIEAVNAHSDRFYREWVDGVPYSAIFGIGWDVDNDGFSKTDPDDWYEEGWLENGFWSQWLSADGETWDWGNGLGMHDLYHGAWIGWSWAPEFIAEPPDVPLIPAPPATGLLALGLLSGARRRR